MPGQDGAGDLRRLSSRVAHPVWLEQVGAACVACEHRARSAVDVQKAAGWVAHNACPAEVHHPVAALLHDDGHPAARCWVAGVIALLVDLRLAVRRRERDRR